MFGRSPRLPIDFMFDIEPNEGSDDIQILYKKFVDNWEKSMQQAFEIVRGHTQMSGNKNKQYYDKKIHGLEINIGDRVWLRNYREKGGTGKLRSHWEDTVYLVTGIDPNVPVYSIRPEMGSKPVKKVYRNNMMSCNFLLSKVINNPDCHNPESSSEGITKIKTKLY